MSKSATDDEGGHLAAGLAYWRYSETSIYNLSPPLLRYVAAAPAYFLLDPTIPPARPYLDKPATSRPWDYFLAFQEQNLHRLHTLVMSGRWMMIGVSVLGGLLVFVIANRLYGFAGGVISLSAWSLSPTILAQGSSIGTDVGCAVACLAAILTWMRFVEKQTPFRSLLSAVMIGVCLCTKFTAILVIPAFTVLAVLAVWRGSINLRPMLVHACICAATTYCLVNASYGYRVWGREAGAFHFMSSTMQSVQSVLPPSLPVPLPRDLLTGFDAQKWEADNVYSSTLFGIGYFGGDWRYYPLILLCKLTLGGIALVVIAAFPRWRRDETSVAVMAAMLILGIAIFAQINIGIRYLVPGMAFAIVLLGRAATTRYARVATIAVIAMGAEAVMSAPRWHSFYNAVGSSLRFDVPDFDRGQSMIELRAWGGDVFFLNNCITDARAYGLDKHDPIAPVTQKYVAIPGRLLNGLPHKAGTRYVILKEWRKLQATTPVADLGGILIYRAEDAGAPAPIAVETQSWQDAIKSPLLPPIRNFAQRAMRD